MNSLDNFEPFDDLEDWSNNLTQSEHADALWELAKLKKGKVKVSEQSSDSIYNKPWIKEPEGFTPTQSWIHWMNKNALHVEMGIPLLAHPNTHILKSVD